MNNQIIYQQIGNEHCEDVIQLILPIQQIEFNVSIDLAAQPDLLAIEENYHQTGGGFWGAFYGEELVGTIALIAYCQDAGAIRKMFVSKDYRGKDLRIAATLLNTLTDHCREKGIRDLYLGTVQQLKAAQRFYEKNGFSQIAMQDLPAAFPRMANDNIFYHKSL